MNRIWILAAAMAFSASAALAQGAAPASGKAPPNVGAPKTGNQPTDALPHGGMAPYGKAPAKTATKSSNMRVAAEVGLGALALVVETAATRMFEDLVAVFAGALP